MLVVESFSLSATTRISSFFFLKRKYLATRHATAIPNASWNPKSIIAGMINVNTAITTGRIEATRSAFLIFLPKSVQTFSFGLTYFFFFILQTSLFTKSTLLKSVNEKYNGVIIIAKMSAIIAKSTNTPIGLASSCT